MLTILLVGLPIILVNMLLQSLTSIWCIRFYSKHFSDNNSLTTGVLSLFGIITIVMLGNFAQIVVWAA